MLIKILRITPKIQATAKLAPGPAKDTFTFPHFWSLKLNGLTGTGFAQPNPVPVVIIRRKGTTIEPIGSKCFIGFKVKRPAYFAVESPIA